MELNQERIEEAVITAATESLLENANLEQRIKTAVDARIDEHFKKIADAQIADAVNQAIKNGFDHEYCRVDSFGRRQGEPTTIRKELEKITIGYWNARVDKGTGKPSDSSYNAISRAEWLMLKIAAGDFSAEMKQHIVNLGGSLKDALRAELRGTLDRLLSEVFYVKSEGDQQLNNPGRSCISPEQKGKL